MAPILVLTNRLAARGHTGQRDVAAPDRVLEDPRRLGAALSAVEQFECLRGPGAARVVEVGDEISWDKLATVHSREYLDSLKRALRQVEETGATLEFGEEVFLSPGSRPAILSAAAAAYQGIDAIARGEARHVFSLCRPAGHHAERDRAMGFCVISNAGLAARHAVSQYGYKVAVVDLDAHRSNGTESTTEGESKVLVCSIHLVGENEYPYSDRDPVREPPPAHVCRIGLPSDVSAREYLDAFNSVMLPRIRAFEPSLVIFSVGFDSLQGDPVGGFNLTPKHLFEVASRVLESGVPSLSVLEGGYDLDHLALGVYGHLLALKAHNS